MSDAPGVVAVGPARSASRRLVWIDQVRAVALYLVVVGHAVAAGTRLETFIYAFHMPLFFIISGMTFRPGRYATVVECAVDKAKKLLIPYVLLSLLMIPWWLLNWRVLAQSDTRIRDLLIGIVVSNQAIRNSPANALWYLPVLFVLSVLFAAIWKVADGRMGRVSMLVACCGVAGIALSVWFREPVPWHLPTVLTAASFYYAGYLFMRHHEHIMERITGAGPRSLALAGVAFAGGAFLALVNGKVSMHHNHYNSVPLFFITALLLSGSVIVFVSQLPRLRWLAYAGANTLVALTVHIPMLRTIQHLSPAALQMTYSQPALVGAAVFAATIPLTIVVNRFAPFLVAKEYPSTTPATLVTESG